MYILEIICSLGKRGLKWPILENYVATYSKIFQRWS